MAFALLLSAFVTLTPMAEPEVVVREFMERRHVPGMAYAVLVNGAMVARGAYGVSDITTKAKVALDSVFPIASLSKPFVAMGVLALAEKNRLSLTEPVGKYLPELPESWRAIPLIRLLDHTSGIPDHFNDGKYEVYDPAAVSSDELIKKLTALPLHFRAGAKYEYSNGNYALLAKVIERVSGEPYEKFLAEKIFQPLGMRNTKALTAADLLGAVHGYVNGEKGPTPFEFNPDWCYGNGALGSTIVDLARLDAALYSEKLLRKSTLDFITTPQPLANGEKPGYAMGWVIGQQRGSRIVTHSGRVGGWESFYARFPDLGATVVVIANNGDVGLQTVGIDLAGTVLPQLAFSPITDQYPDLTAQHLKFVRSIMEGKVDVSRLADGLRRDYEAKDHWSGISKLLQDAGAITSFRPVSRGAKGSDQFTTQYRLEQEDGVWKIELTWDTAGNMAGLMVSSL